MGSTCCMGLPSVTYSITESNKVARIVEDTIEMIKMEYILETKMCFINGES